MWIYQQSTGHLFSEQGKVFARGYSGLGEHKNNPKSEGLKNLGPIPTGRYQIGKPRRSRRTGPFVLDLSPIGHDSLGRTAFQCHGQTMRNLGRASNGCIIFGPSIRRAIHNSGDDNLLVIQ